MITAAQIKRFAPRARQDIVDAIVENWHEAEAAGINTPNRIAHFFTQIAVESAGLRATEESLNYTSAARIRKTWPTRFKTDAAAQPYVRNPEALANKVYGGRMGNVQPGDGWRYRGGGLMQTTGRAGYRARGYEDNPEALREPKIAFLTAVQEWARRGCNALADKGDLVGMRKAINGGKNGLEETRKLFPKAQQVFAGVRGPGVTEKPARRSPAKPKPAPAPIGRGEEMSGLEGVTRAELRLVQERLDELGYHEVGQIDGKYGPRSRNSLLSFKADNGLPAPSNADYTNGAVMLDEPTRDALTRGLRRPVSERRQEARPADIVEDLPEIAAPTFLAAFLGKVQTFLAMIAAAVYGIFGSLGESVSSLAGVREALGDVPPMVWFGLVLLGAAVTWYVSSKAAAGLRNGYRSGKAV